MHLAYRTFKVVSQPENGAKTRRKLLLRWVVSLLVVAFSQPLDYVFGWVPLFSTLNGVLVLLVLVEGQLAVGIGRRFEGRLSGMVAKVSTVCDTFSWFWGVLQLSLCVWLLRLSQVRLKTAPAITLHSLSALCSAYLSDIESLQSPGNPQVCDDRPSPAVPLSPVSAEQSSILDTSCESKADRKDCVIAVKPLPRTQTVKLAAKPPSPSDSTWTVSVQVLTKWAKMHEAVYTPHTVWFDPSTRTLFWHALGEDFVHSDTVTTAKISSRAGLMLQIDLKSSVKVVRFPDVERFVTWSQRFIRAIAKN